MGSVYYGVHEKIAERLAKAHGLTTFIETGTWHGDSAKWAASRFDKVITIEVIEEYYLNSKLTLMKYDNVECVHGDSRTVLTPIVEALTEPVLFWLDAHWTGHKDYSSAVYGGTAVRAEMATINASSLGHVVMVDDARLFPSMMGIEQNEMVKMLLNGGMRDVTIKDDVFYAVPIEKKMSDG